MQSAIAATFKDPDSDQLAEAGDIDDLADFLKTWEILEKSILRTKKIFCSRTFSDLERVISLEPPTVDSDLAAGEMVLEDIDEEIAMKKSVAKQRQQSGNVQSCLVPITSKPARISAPISRRVITFPTRGKKRYVFSSILVVATCCLVWTILHLLLVVLRSRIRVLTTLFASGFSKSAELKDVHGSSGTNTSSSSDDCRPV